MMCNLLFYVLSFRDRKLYNIYPNVTTFASNPQSKPYDRFYSRYVFIKTNRASPEDCNHPKKPGNTPLFSLYLSFLDSRHTVSTWLERP